jgi:hypothetical protein
VIDPRRQRDNPDEPDYENGAFHIEVAGDGRWGVWDAFVDKMRLYFDTDTAAIDAVEALAAASLVSPEALDAEYARQFRIAWADDDRRNRNIPRWPERRSHAFRSPWPTATMTTCEACGVKYGDHPAVV